MIELLRREFGADEWEDRGDGLWRARSDFGIWQYVLIDTGQDAYAGCPAGGIEDVERADDLADFEAAIRRHLAAEIEHMRLPTCVVPGCDEKAPVVFKAAERGRLAGRDWVHGDEIRLCPEHAHDVYQAQDARGRDQLAEWLRPDAKLDSLDQFDADYDSLHGREIAESRARALMVARSTDRPS